MWLLDLIPGGNITGMLTMAAIVIGLVMRFMYKLRKDGANEQKAKQLDAYNKHLQEIERAANARPSGDVSVDPHNRDNRK